MAKTSRPRAPKAAPAKPAAAADRWEQARAATLKVQQQYSAKLRPFIGRAIDPDSNEFRRYEALVAKCNEAIRQVYQEHGFQEAPPERIDTPAKLLDLLNRREAGLQMEREVRKRAGMAPDPNAEKQCYREVRTAALAGRLDIPARTGDAVHDLLTLRQWCQRPRPPSPIKWSRPVSQTSLRTLLLVSQKTLRSRLTDGESLQPGKYRCLRPTRTARKVQIALEDLPSTVRAQLEK